MEGFYNMALRHKEFGEGVIKGWDGMTITVSFARGKMRFWFPTVFETGLLKTTNQKDEETINQVAARWEAVFPRERLIRSKALYAIQCEAQKLTNSKASEEERVAVVQTLHAQWGELYSEDKISEILMLMEEEESLKAKKVEGAADNLQAPNVNGTVPVGSKKQGGNGTKQQSFKNNLRLGINFGNASFILLIVLAALSIAGFILIPVGGAIRNLTVFFVGVGAFLILGFLAHCIANVIYAPHPSDSKGKTILAFDVLTILSYWCLIVFVAVMLYVISFIIKLFKDDFEGFSLGGSQSSEKQWTIMDHGFERTLTKMGSAKYVDGTRYTYYRDDIGTLWLSKDGKNFIKESDL